MTWLQVIHEIFAGVGFGALVLFCFWLCARRSDRLDRRFEALEQKFQTKLDATDRRSDDRYEATNRKIEERFETVKGRIDAVRQGAYQSTRT